MGPTRPGPGNLNISMRMSYLKRQRHFEISTVHGFNRKCQDRDPLIPENKTLPLPPATFPPADSSLKFSEIRSEQAQLRRLTREDRTCTSTSCSVLICGASRGVLTDAQP